MVGGDVWDSRLGTEIWVKIPNILLQIYMCFILYLDQGFTIPNTCEMQGAHRHTPALRAGLSVGTVSLLPLADTSGVLPLAPSQDSHSRRHMPHTDIPCLPTPTSGAPSSEISPMCCLLPNPTLPAGKLRLDFTSYLDGAWKGLTITFQILTCEAEGSVFQTEEHKRSDRNPQKLKEVGTQDSVIFPGSLWWGSQNI